MNLQSTFSRLWEAACIDKPSRPSVTVTDGHFQLVLNGHVERWQEMTEAAGVPSNAIRTVEGERLTCRWPSHADEIFGAGGKIAQRLPAYEVRQPQLHMARMVQRAIESGQPLVAEAGTGVGKSYAYAAIAMAMGRKSIISTSNKALQMQLYKKDIPFLQEIFPGKRVALAVGKSNYACRFKADENGLATKQLQEWYSATSSGNIEEIDFSVDWQALQSLVVDDDCAGKHCPNYYECFYYRAKAERNSADVIITNHALLCLHQLYPGAGILPQYDVLVIDEAHKLPDYARSALGVEFRLSGMVKTIDMAQLYIDGIDTYNEAIELAKLYERQILDWAHAHVDNKTGKLPPQIGMNQAIFSSGQSLALTLLDLANEICREEDMPETAEDRKKQRKADRIRTLANRVQEMSQPGKLVRWLETAEMTLKAAPADVSQFISGMTGTSKTVEQEAVAKPTHCARCNRQLTAPKVAILDGRPYGPECINHVDLLGDAEIMPLAEWMEMKHEPAETTKRMVRGMPVIFCSATLAAPKLDAFMRECGLEDALQMVAASPFDYANNAMLYLPNGSSPAPTAETWRSWAVDEMDALVRASGGGAFLLFTSVSMMQHAAQVLRGRWGNRWTTLVQGELPKLEIAKRFAADGNMVLFATKSFFEGVSIDGQALRLVIIDKMPFEAPSPLSTAMEADLLVYARANGVMGRNLEMYPFNHLRVPRMIIDLKQGAGRLIRTATDTGVIAVLDSRIRSAQYGRSSVIPAMPPAPLVADRSAAESFLHKCRPVVKPEATPADEAMHKMLSGKQADRLSEKLPMAKKVRVEDDGDILWA